MDQIGSRDTSRDGQSAAAVGGESMSLAARWLLLAVAGTPVEAIAAHAGRSVAELQTDLAAARGCFGTDIRVHRARLVLRRALDRSDRRGGPQACWPTTGRISRSGHGIQRCSLLGTTSQPRLVLMVTSAVWDPTPGLVTRHTHHNPACCNPLHLRWGDRAANGADRRRLRLGEAIPPRSLGEVAHLDVLEVPFAELVTLAELEKAFSRVRPDPEWPGCLIKQGVDRATYTHLTLGGRTHKMHRVAVQMTGRTVAPDQVVAHECDHQGCVAGSHLEPTSSARNKQAAVQRGLAPRGGQHWRAQLDDAEAEPIRRAAADGTSPATLAADHSVSEKVVADLVYGHSFAHLPGPRGTPRRRLTDRGVRVVRTAAAFGVTPAALAARLDHNAGYIAELIDGRRRRDAGGLIGARRGAARGRRIPRSVLTDAVVADLDRRVGAGESYAAIARQLGVGPTAVARAHRRRTWRHVPRV